MMRRQLGLSLLELLLASVLASVVMLACYTLSGVFYRESRAAIDRAQIDQQLIVAEMSVIKALQHVQATACYWKVAGANLQQNVEGLLLHYVGWQRIPIGARFAAATLRLQTAESLQVDQALLLGNCITQQRVTLQAIDTCAGGLCAQVTPLLELWVNSTSSVRLFHQLRLRLAPSRFDHRVNNGQQTLWIARDEKPAQAVTSGLSDLKFRYQCEAGMSESPCVPLVAIQVAIFGVGRWWHRQTLTQHLCWFGHCHDSEDHYYRAVRTFTVVVHRV